jgi:hypothetical protein
MRTLIAENGQAYPADPLTLGRLFGFFETTRDLVVHAIRNCGAVLLELRAGCCRIYARPGAVSCPTFERVVGYLAWNPLTAVIIYPAVPQAVLRDVFVNIPDAIARFDQFRTEPRLRLDGPRFSASPLALDKLNAENVIPGMRATYSEWRQARGRFSDDRLNQILKNPTDADCLLTRQDRDGLLFVDALPSYLKHWEAQDPESLIGKSVDHFPDQVYAANAAQAFPQVRRSEKPRLETVDSIVTRTDGLVSIIRYDRLLLPWQSANGEKFVTATAFVRVKRQFHWE